MNAFIDTNVLIAYVFSINSLHFKAKSVFNKYVDIYSSKCVQLEFKKVFREKILYFFNFFQNLFSILENLGDFECSFERLYEFIILNEFFKTDSNCFTILRNFWKIFIGGKYVLLSVVRDNLNKFLSSLFNELFYLSQNIFDEINLTPKRFKKYPDLMEIS